MRLKPSISADVHPFLNTGFDSKFGISEDSLKDVLSVIAQSSHVIIVGIHVHIGSTVHDVSVYSDILQYAKKVIARDLDAFKHVKIINIGGGLAIDYSHQDKAPTPKCLKVWAGFRHFRSSEI